MRIDQITLPENHREATDDDAMKQLEHSLQEYGLLEPIGVEVQNDLYVLVWGFRRLQAAKNLGWEEIEAKVVDGHAEEMRATENIARRPLSAIEEAVAVTRMLNAIKDEQDIDSDEAELALAQRLGKGVGWVRDRTKIAGLAGVPRQALLEGRLQLAAAIQIAKLPDTDDQTEIASWAMADPDGIGHKPIARIRTEVNKHLQDLKKVPWRLDVKFGGGPACEDCPANTANHNRLFEDDDHPRCLDHKCFDKKHRTAKQAITKGAQRVHESGVELTREQTGAACPRYVPLTTFRKYLESQDTQLPTDSKTEEANAEKQHQDALQEYADNVTKAVDEQLTPTINVVIAVAKYFGHEITPELAQELKKPTWATLKNMASGDHDLTHHEQEIIAEALGVLPEKPEPEGAAS